MEDTLTQKQKIFCEEYIVDFNGRQAAIRAGYEPNSASEIASQNLTKLNIQAYLGDLIANRIERTRITQDRVLMEVSRLAFSDIRKAFDDNNNLLNPKDWPDDFAASVSSIKVTEEKKSKYDDSETVSWVKEVKLWDKGKQIELAGRHLGMFKGDADEASRILQEAITIVRASKPDANTAN